jgi:hypothetical protein
MRLPLLAAVTAAALVGSVHLAVSQVSARKLVVDVGQKREVDVDYKIGIQCDDVEIIKPTIVTRGDHNWFIVEGVSPGKTQCRVGTDPLRPSYLFDVIVQRSK